MSQILDDFLSVLRFPSSGLSSETQTQNYVRNTANSPVGLNVRSSTYDLNHELVYIIFTEREST